MGYKIIVDSCGELSEELKASGHFQTVSLEIFVDGYRIVDDESFDQADFLRRMKESPNCPKSACPSPEQYMEAYDCEAERIYAVTLSSQLSGSYNSAQLGRKLYLERHGEKKLHVFDSKSASVGQTLIAMKIQEYEEEGLAFEEIVPKVNHFIEGMNTSFVLESYGYRNKEGVETSFIDYNYMAMTTAEMKMGHEPDTVIQLPECTAVLNNYYIKEGNYIEEWQPEQIGAMLSAAWEEKRVLTLRFSDESLKEQAFQYFVRDGHIADYCYGISQVNYLEDSLWKEISFCFNQS